MTDTTTIVVDAAHGALPGLAEKIKTATAAAETGARTAVQNALLAGELLTQAKGYVQHGQWENWLLSNCSLAPRTAQAYMRLHKKLGQLPSPEAQRVALLPVREAINAITTDATKPKCITGYARPGLNDKQKVFASMNAAAKTVREVASMVNFGSVKRAKLDVARNKLLVALADINTLLEQSEAKA